MDTENKSEKVVRGEVYMVDFGDALGSEQGGIRPALILQNNTGNFYAPTTIVCPMTTKKKRLAATHVMLFPAECGLLKPSILLCEQVRVVDKQRIGKRIGLVTNQKTLSEIEQKMKLSLGIAT